MICDKCHEEVYFLFGRVIDGEHFLLCWDCISDGITTPKEDQNGRAKAG